MAATEGSGSVSPGVLKTKLFKAARSGDVKVLREVLDAGIGRARRSPSRRTRTRRRWISPSSA